MIRVIASSPSVNRDGAKGGLFGTDQHHGCAGLPRAQPTTVAVERTAAFRVNRLQGGEPSHDKCRQMVHSYYKYSVRVAALDQFRSLLNRYQARHTGDRHTLNRPLRALSGGE